METTQKGVGRPIGNSGYPYTKHISKFSGDNINRLRWQKETTLFKKLKELGLLKYLAIFNIKKDDYVNQESFKAVAVLKGKQPKELLKEIVESFIKEAQKKVA